MSLSKDDSLTIALFQYKHPEIIHWNQHYSTFKSTVSPAVKKVQLKSKPNKCQKHLLAHWLSSEVNNRHFCSGLVTFAGVVLLPKEAMVNSYTVHHHLKLHGWEASIWAKWPLFPLKATDHTACVRVFIEIKPMQKNKKKGCIKRSQKTLSCRTRIFQLIIKKRKPTIPL